MRLAVDGAVLDGRYAVALNDERAHEEGVLLLGKYSTMVACGLGLASALLRSLQWQAAEVS